MAVTLNRLDNKIIFLVVGNLDGINHNDVIDNLKELNEKLQQFPELHNFLSFNFNKLISDAEKECFDELFDLLEMHFDQDFADVFITGRYNSSENVGENTYYDTAIVNYSL